MWTISMCLMHLCGNHQNLAHRHIPKMSLLWSSTVTNLPQSAWLNETSSRRGSEWEAEKTSGPIEFNFLKPPSSYVFESLFTNPHLPPTTINVLLIWSLEVSILITKYNKWERIPPRPMPVRCQIPGHKEKVAGKFTNKGSGLRLAMDLAMAPLGARRQWSCAIKISRDVVFILECHTWKN